ncbi:hypothetical protein C0992_011647, partial [Termitomyces sp. T32_za158]
AYDFVQADKRIDPEGEDLPLHRFQEIAEQHVEIRAMQARELRRSTRLKENVEARDLEAQGLADAQAADDEPIGDVSSTDDDITLGQALNSVVPVSVVVDAGDAQLRRRIQQGYAKDAFFNYGICSL